MAIAAVGFAQAPTTNADDPESHDAENVISLYGDSFANIEGVNYDPNWGQSGHNQVDPAFDPGTGNVVLAYPNFNYQGTTFPEQNAASMEYLHVSIWVPEGTDRLVKVSPIDFSGTGPGEVLVEVPLTPGEWNSVDIPIEDFSGMTWQAVRELKFDGQFNADGSANTDPFDVYLDNIFFWKTADTPEADATLSDLQVDGETIENFDPSVLEYTFSLESGTTTVPEITAATPTNDNADVTITQATEIPGDATITVVSEDESRQRIYTVSFVANLLGEAPPAQPARNASDVISIFSDRYNDIEVDTYSADFDDSDFEFVTIDGIETMRIDFGNFIGIDFQSNRQNASEMTHFHMNFWTAEPDLIGKVFNSKFSHWGGGAGEVSAMELNINTGTNPELISGSWVTVDVPIEQFTGSLTRDDLAQFLITSNLDVAYVANIYLYRDGDLVDATIEPFSLLSPDDGTSLSLTGDGSDEVTIEWEEAESNVGVTYAWHADTPGSDFSDPAVTIPSNNNGAATSLTLTFGALDQALADLGVDQGDSITLDWTVTAMANDSVRFAEETFSITLTRDLDDSNGDIPTGNLLTNGDFEDGDDGSWYGNALDIRTEGDNSFNFADVETAGNAFDVNISQDVDLMPGQSYVLSFEASTGAGNTRDMVVGIGESQDPFRANTQTVTLTENTQTYRVDLVATDDGTGEDFGDATSRVLFDMGADVGIVVIDNVSLEASVVTDLPGEAPPAQPERNASDVISIFSDRYDDIQVDTFSADFDDSEIQDVMIDGTPAKRIDFGNFIGIDFQSNRQDASEMTHFHMNFWTDEPDLVGKVFNSKFSQWGGGDDEVSALELNVNTGTDPELVSGQWVTIDVPIEQFTGNLTRDDLAQFLITSNVDVAFVANIYLYKDVGVSNELSESPMKFELNQNYPNPFNPTTNISYTLPESGDVTLEVFNAVGQKVAILVNSTQNAGYHTVSFDASNLASGVYLYRLSSGNQVKINKMLLLK